MTAPQENKESKKEQSNLWFSLSVAGQLGWMIALPIVILAVVGRYLDHRFDSSPVLLLAGILLSIMISSWVVYFKVIKIFADIESDAKKKLNEKDKK